MFYVSQNPKLLNRSIYENIVYSAQHKPTKEDIIKLISSLDLQDSIPKDLEITAGVGGSKLSGGQRQVITLLRLVVADPDIVLLDEPSASLDPIKNQSDQLDQRSPKTAQQYGSRTRR